MSCDVMEVNPAETPGHYEPKQGKAVHRVQFLNLFNRSYQPNLSFMHGSCHFCFIFLQYFTIFMDFSLLK